MKTKWNSFPITLLKLLLTAGIIVGCRLLCGYVLIPALSGFSDGTLGFVLRLLLNVVFVYLIPIGFSGFVFGFWKTLKTNGGFRRLYAKPQHFASSLGIFPTLYGFSQLVNLVVIIALSIVASFTTLDKVFSPVQFTANGLPEALCLLFYMVVIAPIFEELWLRGIIFGELRRYGAGFAIVVQALIFGAVHANFIQFFYATAAGIIFGYVAMMTGSLFTSTVLHAIFNSIGGVIMVFYSLQPIKALIDSNFQAEPAEADRPLVLVFAILMVAVLILLLLGIIMAAKRMPRIIRNIKRFSAEEAAAKAAENAE